jgi:Flp pilus assembly protein TadD
MRAVSALKQATELNPADAWAWNALAVAHSAAGDAARADTAVARAISLDASNQLFQRNRECLANGLSGCKLTH